jgi:hypothetical protein
LFVVPLFIHFVADLLYAVGRLAYLSMPIAYITTTHARICRDLCRPHFSLVTCLASAMVSSSCSEL